MSIDLQSIEAGEWDRPRRVQLRRELGIEDELTWNAIQRVRAVRRKSQVWAKRGRRHGSREQRMEFIQYWMRRVKERKWYRWVELDFNL
jgi:hypothetical protein